MLQAAGKPSLKQAPQIINFSQSVSGGATYTQDFTISAVGAYAYIKIRAHNANVSSADTLIYADFINATTVRVSLYVFAYGGPSFTYYAQFEVVDPNNCKSKQIVSGGSASPIAINTVNASKTEAFLAYALDRSAGGSIEYSFTFTSTAFTLTSGGGAVTPLAGVRIFLVERN
jgi:hypothetical protein